MKKKLRELASVRSGYHFRGKVESDPNGNVALIQIKDLDEDFFLNTNDLMRVWVEDTQSYMIRQGDVLFVTRGTRLGAAVISDALEATIASGSLFILRPRVEILPGFLAWSIRSIPVQAQLRRAGQGSNLLMVRRCDLEEIIVDVPPLEVQHAIVSLDDCARRERRLTAKLNEKRATLVEAVAARAIQSHSK